MMGNNNKILTVSYGTFSCTLEGFEDSFGTMKVIAEYFRDLAQDDRYFGAEPPQPDADMLARIAEREISRRVAAHETDGKIHLSATAPAEPQAEIETAPSTEPAPAPQAPVAPLVAAAPAIATTLETETFEDDAVQDDAAMEAQADTVEVVEDAPTQAQQDIAAAAVGTGSIADKLQRIRAVVNKAKSAPIITSEYEDDEAGEFVAQTAASLEDALEEDAALDQPVQDERAADAAEIVDDTAEVAEAEATDWSTDAAASEFSASDYDAGDYEEDDHGFVETSEADVAEVEPTVADIVTEADAEAADGEEVDNLWTSEMDTDAAQVEDTDADDTPSLSELAAELSGPASNVEDTGEATGEVDADDNLVADDADAFDALAEDVQPEAAEANIEVTGSDDLVADVDAAADAEWQDDVLGSDASDSAEAGEDVTDEIGSQIDVSDMMSRIDAAEPEEDEIAAQTPNPEDALKAAMRDALGEDETDVDASADDSVDMSVDMADDATEGTAGDDTFAPAAARTRILKVEKSALEEALASGLVEDDSAPASSLSAEEEAELEADLAQVQADIEKDAQAEAAPLILSQENAVSADAETDAYDDEEAPELEETDVDRLMDKADAQMEEPETAKRRNAFQALKAAVAARKADKGLSKDSDADDSDAYRSDLAEVVQPAPAETTEVAASRVRVKTRAAPLRLVAEQRVDETPAPAPVAEPAARAEDDTATEFEKYAAELGAHALPDLLEAAASYLAFVEGKEQFSRPQLITKVRQVQQAQFSREDGLRSFGQLLRAGKIEKVRGGRFTVTSDIGYRPDKRVAG